MIKNIFVYSAPIKTGKTSNLMRWATLEKYVAGILQPVVNGKRFLYDITGRELKEFQVQSESKDTVSIGNYIFSINAFSWANEKIKNLFRKDYKWLIIDEVGKLEIGNKGLIESVEFVIANAHLKPSTNFLFVVRDTLFKEFIDKFHIAKDEIQYFEYR